MREVYFLDIYHMPQSGEMFVDDCGNMMDSEGYFIGNVYDMIDQVNIEPVHVDSECIIEPPPEFSDSFQTDKFMTDLVAKSTTDFAMESNADLAPENNADLAPENTVPESTEVVAGFQEEKSQQESQGLTLSVASGQDPDSSAGSGPVHNPNTEVTACSAGQCLNCSSDLEAAQIGETPESGETLESSETPGSREAPESSITIQKQSACRSGGAGKSSGQAPDRTPTLDLVFDSTQVSGQAPDDHQEPLCAATVEVKARVETQESDEELRDEQDEELRQSSESYSQVIMSEYLRFMEMINEPVTDLASLTSDKAQKQPEISHKEKEPPMDNDSVQEVQVGKIHKSADRSPRPEENIPRPPEDLRIEKISRVQDVVLVLDLAKKMPNRSPRPPENPKVDKANRATEHILMDGIMKVPEMSPRPPESKLQMSPQMRTGSQQQIWSQPEFQQLKQGPVKAFSMNIVVSAEVRKPP